MKYGDTYTELGLLEMYFFCVADIATIPKAVESGDSTSNYIRVALRLQSNRRYNDIQNMAPSNSGRISVP